MQNALYKDYLLGEKYLKEYEEDQVTIVPKKMSKSRRSSQSTLVMPKTTSSKESTSNDYKVNKQLYGKEKEYNIIKEELTNLLKVKTNLDQLVTKKDNVKKELDMHVKLLKKECSKITLEPGYDSTACPYYVGSLSKSKTMIRNSIHVITEISPKLKNIIVSNVDLDKIMIDINIHNQHILKLQQNLDELDIILEVRYKNWDSLGSRYEYLKKQLYKY